MTALTIIYNVCRREWMRITSRRLYIGVCLILPLFSLFFMATIFGNGQMEQLPIAIVDLDNTSTSRSIIRRVEATPTFLVSFKASNETEARQALQRKEIYGYLVIPHRFQANISHSPTLTYYYHYALLSVGGELMAAFENTLAAVSISPIIMKAEALGVEEGTIQTFLLPIEGEVNPVYNPNMNYSVYLSYPFFFILLQIQILLVTVYTLGNEIKMGTSHQWIAHAQGNILFATVGKLIPYTLIFTIVALFANYVLLGNILVDKCWLLINSLTFLFIIATQALAVFIFSFFPQIAYIISAVSMIGSLGATLSGVTFPIQSMYAPVQFCSFLLPIRHFTEATHSILYFQAGFIHIWHTYCFLLLFPLAALLMLPLLKKWIAYFLQKENIPPTTRLYSKALPTRLTAVIRREWYNISTNPAIILVLAGGIFLYGLLYNYMYTPNTVQQTPIAVVDLSHSSLSREYIRWLDATPQVSIYKECTDMQEAKEWMKRGEVYGVLYLPSNFEQQIRTGNQTVYLFYASTETFLQFKGMKEATTRVMLALNDAHRADGIVFLPIEGIAAVEYSNPISIIGTALYNPSGGYASYLIPAVVIVIIFQTMLMVISMVRGEEREKRSRYGTHFNRLSALPVVIGRSLVYTMLYALFSVFLLGLIPYVFHIPHMGNWWEIVAMMIPFLISTSLLAQALSRWFTDAEAPLLMIAFFSVGYIFLSGISYPLESMPWYWNIAHYIFPVTPAILAFIKLNSMGGNLADISPQLAILWIQVFVYGAWAMQTVKWQAKKMAIYPRQPIFC